jgi:hypothetical protein
MLSGLVALVALLLLPSIASAQLVTLPPAVDNAITDGSVTAAIANLEETGGTGSSLPSMPAGSVASDLYMSEMRVLPGQPSSDYLWGELNQLAEAAAETGTPGLVTASSVSGVGAFALGATAFGVGWEIGSGLRALYHHFAAPAAPGISVPGATVLDSVSMTPIGRGQVPPTGCGGGGCTAAPAPGWALQLTVHQSTSPGTHTTSYSTALGGQPCQSGIPASTSTGVPGTEFETIAGSTCSLTVAGPAVQVGWLFVRYEKVATGQPQTYVPGSTSQPVDKQFTDNTVRTAAATQTAIGNELRNHPGDYPVLVQKLDHDLGGPSPDPTLLTIPAPLAHETYGAYVTRLRAGGLLGTVSHGVLTDAEVDTSRAASEVVTTDPAPGTNVADATTSVTVWTNPVKMPSTSTGGSTDTDPGAGGSGWSPPSPPGIDFTPLQSIGSAACSSFPFGIPCYVIGAVGGLSGGAADAPSFTIPLPSIGAGSNSLTLDLAAIQPVVDLLRPLFLLMSFVGLVMWLGRKSSNNDAADGDD